MELFDEIQQLTRCLTTSLKELRKTGTAYAEAEKQYRIAARHEALKLRDEGMAVTMINLVLYGTKAVADLRFQRDVAEAVYKANQEAINTYKLQIRICENQLSREYGSLNI